jgi:hypothetical protein
MVLVEVVVYVAVEVFRPMEPWTSADELSFGEPFRAIVAIGRAGVRGVVVVTVRARGRGAGCDLDLRGAGDRSGKADSQEDCKREKLEFDHDSILQAQDSSRQSPK